MGDDFLNRDRIEHGRLRFIAHGVSFLYGGKDGRAIDQRHELLAGGTDADH